MKRGRGKPGGRFVQTTLSFVRPSRPSPPVRSSQEDQSETSKYFHVDKTGQNGVWKQRNQGQSSGSGRGDRSGSSFSYAAAAGGSSGKASDVTPATPKLKPTWSELYGDETEIEDNGSGSGTDVDDDPAPPASGNNTPVHKVGDNARKRQWSGDGRGGSNVGPSVRNDGREGLEGTTPGRAIEMRRDRDKVLMPSDPENVLRDGHGNRIPTWMVICQSLSTPITSADELKEAILAYNPRHRGRWTFANLERYINGPNKNFIFSTLLPGMCALALRLLDYFPNSESIPLLKQSFDTHITLSQIEIAVLLANAFFCTFPSRNDFGKDAEFAGYPTINFDSLFSRAKIAERNAAKMAKLDMVFHYFARVIKNAPTGFVTFHRCVLPEQGFPAWESLNMPLCDLEVRNTGTIEDDASGLLQADFANKFIGGGVLNSGCVQEEIRFLINPELLITRLFIERLHDHEAVVIVGVERFSQYSGYADTFRWAGNYVDTDDNRRRTQIVAMDALFFANKPKTEQYKLWAIERELKKAYIAFKPLSASGSGPPSAIATGNWGCGAFAGDLELKAIIQLIAASAHSRGVRYFTFGQTEFGDDLAVIRARLADRGVTAGTLFKMVRLFHEELRGNMAAGMKLADCSLFKYLHELLDLDAD